MSEPTSETIPYISLLLLESTTTDIIVSEILTNMTKEDIPSIIQGIWIFCFISIRAYFFNVL